MSIEKVVFVLDSESKKSLPTAHEIGSVANDLVNKVPPYELLELKALTVKEALESDAATLDVVPNANLAQFPQNRFVIILPNDEQFKDLPPQLDRMVRKLGFTVLSDLVTWPMRMKFFLEISPTRVAQYHRFGTALTKDLLGPDGKPFGLTANCLPVDAHIVFPARASRTNTAAATTGGADSTGTFDETPARPTTLGATAGESKENELFVGDGSGDDSASPIPDAEAAKQASRISDLISQSPVQRTQSVLDSKVRIDVARKVMERRPDGPITVAGDPTELSAGPKQVLIAFMKVGMKRNEGYSVALIPEKAATFQIIASGSIKERLDSTPRSSIVIFPARYADQVSGDFIPLHYEDLGSRIILNSLSNLAVEWDKEATEILKIHAVDFLTSPEADSPGLVERNMNILEESAQSQFKNLPHQRTPGASDPSRTLFSPKNGTTAGGGHTSGLPGPPRVGFVPGQASVSVAPSDGASTTASGGIEAATFEKLISGGSKTNSTKQLEAQYGPRGVLAVKDPLGAVIIQTGRFPNRCGATDPEVISLYAQEGNEKVIDVISRVMSRVHCNLGTTRKACEGLETCADLTTRSWNLNGHLASGEILLVEELKAVVNKICIQVRVLLSEEVKEAIADTDRDVTHASVIDGAVSMISRATLAVKDRDTTHEQAVHQAAVEGVIGKKPTVKPSAPVNKAPTAETPTAADPMVGLLSTMVAMLTNNNNNGENGRQKRPRNDPPPKLVGRCQHCIDLGHTPRHTAKDCRGDDKAVGGYPGGKVANIEASKKNV